MKHGLLALLLYFASIAFAAETHLLNIAEVWKRNSAVFTWDFNVNSFSNSYGLGASVGSPYFFNDKVNFRLAGSYGWVQGTPKGQGSETWAPFGMLKLGLFGSNFLPGTLIRGYGGGGPLLLLPSDAVSSADTVSGGFGIVGVEFFLTAEKSLAMFVELGGMGTGARATGFENDPIYANGFTASWGFRGAL